MGVIRDPNNHPMEEEEWVYAWEENLIDEDGQLWVVTMSSLLILPILEDIIFAPLIMKFPGTAQKAC